MNFLVLFFHHQSTKSVRNVFFKPMNGITVHKKKHQVFFEAHPSEQLVQISLALANHVKSDAYF